MGTENFYKELQGFSKFSGIVEAQHFHRVPSDWKVVITDVQGSTLAIEAGRYKDVNVVGAAAIACVQNIAPEGEIPFVFGGDGATFIVPPQFFESVIDELLALKALAKDSYDFHLRVGAVEISEIEGEGAEVQIARFERESGSAVAILRGGGVTVAEEKIKKNSEGYEFARPSTKTVDLGGLSCRWQPIPSQKGRVLSLLVIARPGKSEVYREVLDRLDAIYDGDMETANPIALSQMQYRSLGECLRDERRYHESWFSPGYFLRAVGIFYSIAVFKMKVPAVFFDAKKYVRTIPAHSDYRKFDDALRMIVDCSDMQVVEIRSLLSRMYEQGDLFFGIHESETSLMTCFVPGVSDGKHIHFVDGGDGGYTMAAKGLKEQIALAAKEKRQN